MGISKYENAAAVDEALDKGVEAWNRAVINNASDIIYDNSASGLEAENVQNAIDEMKDKLNIPVYTLEEYEAEKDNIPVNTVFIVTDDNADDKSGKSKED